MFRATPGFEGRVHMIALGPVCREDLHFCVLGISRRGCGRWFRLTNMHVQYAGWLGAGVGNGDDRTLWQLTSISQLRHTVIVSTMHGHIVIVSTMHGHIVIVSTMPGHIVIVSTMPGHIVIVSTMHGHTVIVSTMHGHTVIVSTMHGHTVIVSTMPGHTVIVSTMPGHTVIVSTMHGHTVIVSTMPGHQRPTQSEISIARLPQFSKW